MVYLRKLWEVVRQKGLRTHPATWCTRICRCICGPARLAAAECRQGADRSGERSSRDVRVRRYLHAGRTAAHRLYGEARPLFELHHVEENPESLGSQGVAEIRRLSDHRSDRGDDHIDVNTGAFVGHRNLEETIFRTNLERQ